jgi:hypothetical protein
MRSRSANSELKTLFDMDCREHADVPAVDTPEYAALRERDRVRRVRAQEIVSSSRSLTADDLYHAAWLFNHGDEVDEAKLAHALSNRAADLGHLKAHWLSAAAYDRWCMYQGRAQKYGTQIVPDGSRYRVWDTEPGTSDEERKAFGVPALEEQHRRAEELSRRQPQPSLEQAPQWLKLAIVRWQSVPWHDA